MNLTSPRQRSIVISLSRGSQGFTLLELLLVVFILSAVALSTVSFTNNADEQFRFEDTRTRLGNIRTAVIGQPTQTLNGEPAVSGFVADAGRLPNTLQEMLEPGSLPAWTLNSATGLWAGWRGPYLTTLVEQVSGTKTFRDGWGNAGGVPNYGWGDFTADQATGTLIVQSLGADGAAGGTSYAAEYPPSGSLVERLDHQLNARGWSATVTFDNTSGGAAVIAANALRVRLYYPQDGSFAWTDSTQPGFSWPATSADRDLAAYLSLAFPATPQTVPAGGTLSVSFEFGSAVDKWVPWGVRSLGIVNDADGSVYDPGVVASKPQSITLVPRAQIVAVTMTWRVD